MGANDLRGRRSLNTVTDHETDTKKIDCCAAGNVVFIVAGVFDGEGNNNGGDGGGEAECLGDVAGGGDGVRLHHPKVGEEIWLNRGIENGCV